MSYPYDPERDHHTFPEVCAGCMHYWERKGRCTLAGQGSDPQTHVGDRVWTITHVRGTIRGTCSKYDIPDYIRTEMDKEA